MRRAVNCALCFLLVGLAAGRAEANRILVTDQGNGGSTAGGYSVEGSTPVGQSFSPRRNELDYAVFVLRSLDDPGGPGSSFSVSLLQGSGTGGILLATSRAAALGAGQFASLEFDFDARVTLNSKLTYTLLLNALTPGSQTTLAATGDTYSGGSLYLNGRAVAADAIFSEGLIAYAPEPSTWAGGLTAAAAGAGAAWRRRRRTGPRGDAGGPSA